MWLLDIAWRVLVQKGTEKFLKETSAWKKIVKAIAPKNKPQTPQGEGLSFWGTTTQSYIENRWAETRQAISELPQSYLKDEFDEEPISWIFKWFNSLESNALVNSQKATQFKNDIFNMAKGDTEAKKKLQSTLSKESFDKYDKWSTFASNVRKNVIWTKENWFQTAASSVVDSTPFASSVLDKVSWWRYSASKFAKEQLQSEWKFSQSTSAKVVGTGVWLLGWYGIYGKIADATILWNKWLQATKVTSQFQNAMRESYARNPFLFNFTSNSAQEAIEYWVRKWLGDENYSTSDLVMWITWGAIFSKLFAWKKLDSIFDNLSTKDLDNINDWLKRAKELNPEASNKELFDSIVDTKLNSWMTFGELKQSFINAGGKIGDNMKAWYDNVVNYFHNVGVRTSSAAGKRIDSFLEEINTRIWKGEQSKWILSADKDITQFKQDVLSDLTSRTQLTHSDVDEIITARAKEYWVKLNDTKSRLDIFDEAEEVVMREGSEITNLTNPKTMDWFKYQYLGKNDFDADWLRKLQDEIDLYSSLKPTAKRLTKIDENKAKIKAMLSDNGYKSIKDAEDARYRVTTEKVNELAKASRKPWTKWRITNAEKDKAREAIINETRKLEAEAEKIITKMSWLKSVTWEWDFAKIIQYTQLKQAIDSWDYRGALKSFIETNKPLVSKKWIEESWLWVDGKVIEKQRAQADVNEITMEASKQDWGMFRLSADEESWSLKKIINFLTPFLWDRKRGSSIFQWLDTPINVMERVFGKDSHFIKLVKEIPSARSRWRLESIQDFEAPLVKLISDAKLGDTQLQRKFMIYMTTRQWWMNDRITKANNLWIDENGKIWDDIYDTKPSIEERSAVDVPSHPDSAKHLTDSHIEDITKEIEGNPQFTRIIQFLDNKFNNVASRLNAQNYRDTWVLIPNEDKYFPIIYKNANYFKWGEEPRNSLSQIFSSSVQKWFLQARKATPDDFDINTDLAVMIRSFQDNQLYYLHMKEPITRLKRATRNSNKKGINMDDLDEGVYYNKKKDTFEWKDYVDDWVVEGRPVMSKPLRDYIDWYIEHIEHRWVVSEKASIIKSWSRLISNVNTWSTIAANVWSMVSQYFSFADLIGNLDKIGDVGSFIRWVSTLNPFSVKTAAKYSWALLERMTEHTQWVALWRMFNAWDMKAISQSKWMDWIGERAIEMSLRWMRKTDGQVSYWVWTTYAHKFLKDNHHQFPEVKITTNIDELNKTMPPSWFKKMIDYADVEMNRTMGSSADFTMSSELMRHSWSVYKVATSIQKTFINRLLFLNHILSTKWMKSIPAVGIALWVWAYLESEREYWRSVYDSNMGKKEFKILEEDVDFWLFIVKADSHWGKMLANNPSLTYDSFESKIYDWVMKKATWKPELSMAEILAARAMGKFFSDNFWNPMNRYEISSITRWYDSIKNRNEKGEVAPWFRNDLELWYAIVKMILPWATRDIIPAIHQDIFEEPLWQTLEDNYQLGKITKNKPELSEELSSQSFKAQWDFAKNDRKVYEAGWEIRKEKERAKATLNETAKSILSEKWVEKMDEDAFINYVVDNPQVIEWMSDWDIEELWKLLSTWKPDIRTDIYAPYRKKTTDTIIIYNDFLKEYVDNEDFDWLERMMDELEAQDVIKNREWFEKTMLKIIEWE